jgi:hypothetical protein
VDATNMTLVLTNVQLTDDGQFLAVITNDSSAVTSHVANLTVFVPSTNPPVITNITITPSSPVLVGTNVTISAAAGGTGPLSYQWFFQNFVDFTTNKLTDGTNISGTTNSSLSISNVQTSDIGNYIVVVTNNFGVAIGQKTLGVVTNSSGSTNSSSASLRTDPARSLPKASLHAARAHVPIAPDVGLSPVVLNLTQVQERQRKDLRGRPINPAAPPMCGEIDAARLWTSWRDARPPHKTSPDCYRSFPAIV